MAEKTQTPNSLDAQPEGSFEKKTVPYFSSIAVDLGSVRLPSISFAGREGNAQKMENEDSVL